MFKLKLISLLIFIWAISMVKMVPTVENDKQVAEIIATNSKTKKFSNQTIEKLGKVVKRMAGLSSKIDNVKNYFSNRNDNMRIILTDKLREDEIFDEKMSELARRINTVDSIHENYQRYSSVTDANNDHSKKEFVRATTSSDPEHLKDQMYRIGMLVSSSESTGQSGIDLLTFVARDALENADLSCDNNLSVQQQIYAIYLMLISLEKKALEVLKYSYKELHKIHKENSYAWDWNLVNEDAKKRIERYYGNLQKAVQIAPLSIRRCDPLEPLRQITSIEFEKLFGLYVINEMDSLTNGNCKGTCEDAWTSTSVSTSDANTDVISVSYPAQSQMQYDLAHQCHGSLTKCRSLYSVDYCRIPNSPRRFEWFKDYYDTVYGDKKADCHEGEHNKYESTSKSAFWRCDYCMCDCNTVPGGPNGIILVSLMQQVTDINNNEVVTGIRFDLNSGLVYLQIQEGKLQAEGKVIDSRWQPPKNITNHKNMEIKLWNEDETHKTLNRDVDYQVLSSHAKTFYLDDILIPKEYVVTGVRLNVEDNAPTQGEKAIYLEVLATPFDYKTGKLKISKENPSIWVSYKTTRSPAYEKKRSELVLRSPDNPLKNGRNFIDSQPNQFVQLQHSDPKLDAGQSVVPFLDAEPVEAHPDTMLSGIGTFHRGALGFGGFIALKILTYDISSHIAPVSIETESIE